MRLSRYGCEGEPSGPDAALSDIGDGTWAWNWRHEGPSEMSVFLECCKLPRKEVIHPHVLVRIPCYDFTPLTLHTFGTSLPCGLGRRLRVQTTRVV